MRSTGRFLTVVGAVICAFAASVYLTGAKTNDAVVVLFDGALADDPLVLADLREGITASGAVFTVGAFDAQSPAPYLMASPEALFVSEHPLKSAGFPLRMVERVVRAVAVGPRGGERVSITSGEFDALVEEAGISGGEAQGFTIDKNRIAIVPYEHLGLDFEPIRVDGVYPSIGNMRNGAYRGSRSVFVHARCGSNAGARGGSLDGLENSGPDDCFSLIAGGDIMLARGVVRDIDLYGIDWPFREIAPEIAGHELAAANLESPISSRGRKFAPDKGIYFRADPRVIEGLAESGFDFLSLANNHSLDWGTEAIRDTRRFLDERGIRSAGVGRTRREALEPAVFELKGKRVAFVALNGVYPFSVSDSGMSYETSRYVAGETEKEIKLLKEKYDILIVSIHSGAEYIREQEDEKVRQMRGLVDAGADLVLGHHPHVVQDVEVYKDRIISYSLGNLIFDQSWSEDTSRGLLLEVGFVGSKAAYFDRKPVVIDRSQARMERNERIPAERPPGGSVAVRTAEAPKRTRP